MDKKKTGSETVQKAEKAGFSTTYHQVLLVVELFFCMRNVLNLITSFMNPAGTDRTVDQIFYVVMFVLALISVIWHDRKAGVISLHVFIVLELAWTCFIYMVAGYRGLDVPDLNEKMFSWTLGSMAWFVPTFLYYRKRWRFLK